MRQEIYKDNILCECGGILFDLDGEYFELNKGKLIRHYCKNKK